MKEPFVIMKPPSSKQFVGFLIIFSINLYVSESALFIHGMLRCGDRRNLVINPDDRPPNFRQLCGEETSLCAMVYNDGNDDNPQKSLEIFGTSNGPIVSLDESTGQEKVNLGSYQINDEGKYFLLY